MHAAADIMHAASPTHPAGALYGLRTGMGIRLYSLPPAPAKGLNHHWMLEMLRQGRGRGAQGGCGASLPVAMPCQPHSMLLQPHTPSVGAPVLPVFQAIGGGIPPPAVL